jgi:hypothetical protein
MAWLDNIAELADALVDPGVFGEPVILPDGVTVNGVFVEEPARQSVWGQSGDPGIGAWGRASKPTPELYLHPDNLASISEGDTIEVHGGRFRIVAIDPEHDGLHRLELMRDTDPTDETKSAAWR